MQEIAEVRRMNVSVVRGPATDEEIGLELGEFEAALREGLEIHLHVGDAIDGEVEADFRKRVQAFHLHDAHSGHIVLGKLENQNIGDVLVGAGEVQEPGEEGLVHQG